MKALGPTSRNLLASARRGLDPSADVAARVRAKVAHAVGAGAVATTTSSAGAVSFGAGKLAAIVLVVGALAGGGLWFAHSRASRSSAGAPAISELSLDSDTPIAIRSASGAPIIAPVFTPATPERTARIAPPIDTPRVQTTPAVQSSQPAEPPPPAGPITLAREVQLVDGAIDALRQNDVTGALEILTVYDREAAGHGQLAEDAAAVQIEARCRDHQVISDQLAAFDQHFPHSVQRARITASCAK